MTSAARAAVVLVLCGVACATGRWSVVDVKGAYVPRSETAMAPCGGGALCLLGGRGRAPVGVLDTAKLAWTQGATPPIEIHHFQAVEGPDGCVWIAGAWSGPFPDEVAVKDVWKYCRGTNKWTKVGPIARPRGSAGAVAYDGALYIVSGNNGGHKEDADVVPWFDKYDFKSGKWTEMPDIPHPRDHMDVAIVDGKLYVAGGRDSGAFDFPDFFAAVEKNVDVFDFASGKWSTLDAEFTRKRAGTMAATFKDTVVVVGGESDSPTAWTESDILEDGKFAKFPDMPVERHAGGLVSCNGALWVAGGVKVQGGGVFAEETVAYFEGDKPPACTEAAAATVTPTPATETDAPESDESSNSRPAASGNTDASSEGELPTPFASPATESPSPSTAAATNTTPVTTPNSTPDSTPDSTPNSTLDAISDSTPDSTTESTPDATPDSTTFDPNPAPTPTAASDFAPEAEASPTSDGTSGVSSATGDDADADDDADNSDSDNNNACFPTHATVELENGSVKTMAEVKIGDRVKVAHPDQFSDVFFFSHRHPHVASKVVHIKTSVDGAELQLSPGHLLYVNGESAPASSVRVGDVVSISHGHRSVASVTAVKSVLTKGLFNPHTVHGDIVVNRVVARTFTTTVHPTLARMLLHPFKLAFHFGGPHAMIEDVNQRILRALDSTVWA